MKSQKIFLAVYIDFSILQIGISELAKFLPNLRICGTHKALSLVS